jgi:glyoxylase-like metal-dependent hydrolase (beta-lactamase superfamily II)
MASQGFAILGAGRVILIDTCLGGPKPDRTHPMPGFASRWLSTLESAGISPDSVDTVINTHLHHDHVGWNTTLTNDGALLPTFPNARSLIAQDDYAHFTGHPADFSKQHKHIADSVLPVQRAGLLELGNDTRIDDDVRLIPAPGHTPGHTLVEISSQGRRVLLAADLIHHPLQLRRPDISTAMCVDPDASATTRTTILNTYADTGTLFLAAHLPEGGYLHRDRDTFTLTPTQRTAWPLGRAVSVGPDRAGGGERGRRGQIAENT